jgi:flagellar biosynthesis/type III secretory pathway chaperone
MTTPPSQYLYRDVLFHPPEADHLADKILQKIRELTSQKETLLASVNYLDFNWEGQRKDKFIADVDPHKRNLLDQLENLIQQEKFFRAIHVTKREPYVNPDWETYMRSRH